MPSADAVVLPANVKPVKYRMTLQPDLGNFTFKGEQTVDIEIVTPTARIEMNAAELEISGVTLRRPPFNSPTEGGRGEAFPAQSIALDENSETVTLDFGRTLSQGPAQLEMRFTGTLNDRLVGFYRSEYQDNEGRTRHLATTQFEATDARRAFPCWDEPARKAVFDVTLVFDDSLQAVSNTPIVEESSPGPGLRSVRFGETPIMSTYLLAFVVGDLVSVEAEAVNGTTIGVWTTQGKENQAGVCPGHVSQATGLLQRVFWHTLPAAQAGPHRHPGLRCRGHGKLGLHHLPRDRAAGRSRKLVGWHPSAGGRGGGP